MTETTATAERHEDERLRRYAEAIEDDCVAAGGVKYGRLARAVMAVADAEQAAGAAVLLRGVAGVLANTQRETVPLAAVLETLYEVADRIEVDGSLLAPPVDPERHVCPECEQGKHANCDGTAWDDAKDAPTSCTCQHEGVS